LPDDEKLSQCEGRHNAGLDRISTRVAQIIEVLHLSDEPLACTALDHCQGLDLFHTCLPGAKETAVNSFGRRTARRR